MPRWTRAPSSARSCWSSELITAVVAAAFDSDSYEAINLLRVGLPIVVPGPKPRMAHPHLTLSAARVDGPEAVTEVAADVAARHRSFELVFTALGQFPSVVYAEPRRTAKLTRLHQDVWQSMIDAGWPPAFAGQSDPTTWVPHCTLMRGGSLTLPARDVEFEPVRVRVTALETIIVGKGRTARVELR